MSIKHNHYLFLDDCVYAYPQGRNDIYTILDYKWYKYFKDEGVYLRPSKDRDNGYYWKYSQNGKRNNTVHGTICGKYCDHINGNKSDNRESNLRKANSLQNSRNRKYTKLNKTGYKGVQKELEKYCAQIRIGKKLLYFGEFAWTNFPKDNYTMEEINSVEPPTMKNRRREYRKKVL